MFPNVQSKRLFVRLDAGVAETSRRTPQEVERQPLESAADFLDDPDSGRTCNVALLARLNLACTTRRVSSFAAGRCSEIG